MIWPTLSQEKGLGRGRRRRSICVYLQAITQIYEHAYTEMSLWIDTTANKIGKTSFLSSQSRGLKFTKQEKK